MALALKNKTCPYCQSPVKAGADIIECPTCGTPHHKECWEENGGCTTFGCEQNPASQNNNAHVTSAALIVPSASNLVNCFNCRSLIDENSVYCKFCGERVTPAEGSNRFEVEFRKRYRQKALFNRRRKLITVSSFIMLVSLFVFLVFVTIQKSHQFFAPQENTFSEFLSEWKHTWESKNIDDFGDFLTEDYRYHSTGKTSYNKRQRLTRLKWTFDNYNFIKLDLNNVTSESDSNSAVIKFNQVYRSDKYDEEGKKTLYLRNDQNRWRIYREVFE